MTINSPAASSAAAAPAAIDSASPASSTTPATTTPATTTPATTTPATEPSSAPSVAPETAPASPSGAGASTATPATPTTERPFSHTDVPSLLADGKPPVPEFSRDIYNDIELPEGVARDAEANPTYGKFLDIAERHKLPKESAQELVNLWNDAVASYTQQASEAQQRAFDNVRAGWRNKVLEDEVVGGAGHETALNTAKFARDMFVSDVRASPNLSPEDKAARQADIAEFTKLMDISGVGDHPVMVRFLHRIGRFLKEPGRPRETPAPPSNRGSRPGRKNLADTYTTMKT